LIDIGQVPPQGSKYGESISVTYDLLSNSFGLNGGLLFLRRRREKELNAQSVNRDRNQIQRFVRASIWLFVVNSQIKKKKKKGKGKNGFFYYVCLKSFFFLSFFLNFGIRKKLKLQLKNFWQKYALIR
jgi:hypothetical protein